ncbi:hypothetical protein T190115A13A_20121 [Tenacibaculum sp. 190524A02b]|uniref:Bacteriocin n=2 Tax=Tenacibaculum vairaonense TaxID=3137860 RepID=A0ABM9PMI6_9FLAO
MKNFKNFEHAVLTREQRMNIKGGNSYGDGRHDVVCIDKDGKTITANNITEDQFNNLLPYIEHLDVTCNSPW